MTARQPQHAIERMAPALDRHEVIYAEHLVRYQFATAFAPGKRILDVACGTGYGADLLKKAGASRVVGLDVASEALRYARQAHSQFSPEYVQGDAQRLPFCTGSFDLIVSFETLEHLPDQDAFLSELHRVLTPGGMLLISTPNVAVYQEQNPFHVKELQFAEFLTLVSAFFRHVEVLGQDNWITSTIATAEGGSRDDLNRDGLSALKVDSKDTRKSLYLLAIASDQALPRAEPAALIGKSFEDFRLEHLLQAGLLQAKSRQLEEAQAQIQAITEGRGYRALGHLWQIRLRLAPPGSRRARVADRVETTATSSLEACLRGLEYWGEHGPKSFLGRMLQVWLWLPRALGHGREGPLLPHARIDLSSQDEIDGAYQHWLATVRGSHSQKVQDGPTFSLIVFAGEGGREELSSLAETVLRQKYAGWELVVVVLEAADCLEPVVPSVMTEDSRVRTVRPKGISEALAFAEGLRACHGEFVSLITPGARLKPGALLEIARTILENPGTDVVYSDEDLERPDGSLGAPFFKPDWCGDLLLCVDYISRSCAIRRSLVENVVDDLGSGDADLGYDLCLRVTENTDRVTHLPVPLFTFGQHARRDLKRDRAAVSVALSRRGIEGEVTDTPASGWLGVRRSLRGTPRVSVIVPTRDKPEALGKCLDGLRQSGYRNLEIIVADNGSIEPRTREVLSATDLTVLRVDEPFNFSRLINLAAARASGEFLLLINNDTEAISPGWIEALLEQAQRPEVAVVGCRLVYADGAVQHEGVAFSGSDIWSLRHLDWRGYLGFRYAVRECIAVTAACMMTKRSVFEALGGFEESLRVAYGDIDYCLRARHLGLKTVYTPFAELIHHEGLTRGDWTPQQDQTLANQKWSGIRDPYLSPVLAQVFQPFAERSAPFPEPYGVPAFAARLRLPEIAEPNRLMAELREFLSDGAARLTAPACDDPDVSIIIPVYNRAELTLQCLKSLRDSSLRSFELIIVDNASSDATPILMGRLENALLIRNEENLHFLAACNEAASRAHGRYLVLLNNDTYLLPRTLEYLVETAERHIDGGAVGCKLVFPDGRLQEAGSIVWQDASITPYGRSDDPDKDEYSFLREVDYCSAACLLVRRDLWREIGGFDDRFAPAYYEDVDLCFSLREKGYKVLYQPKAVAFHLEHASSASSEAQLGISRNRAIFKEKWRRDLESRPPPGAGHVLRLRDTRNGQPVLVVDDCVPRPSAGVGYPRTAWMVQLLAELGYKVTLLPLQDQTPWEPETTRLQDMGVEIACARRDLKEFLSERSHLYRWAIVSRPHNAVQVVDLIRGLLSDCALIYDAEALFFRRQQALSRLTGDAKLKRAADNLKATETELISQADVVVAVSESERRSINLLSPNANVKTWTSCVPASPFATPFGRRRNLLFVGSFFTPGSPNEDAIEFFAREVWPRVANELPGCRLVVAGWGTPKSVFDLASSSIDVLGFVSDLGDLYDKCRILLAPLRFGAGVSLKVLEAMAAGLPAIVSEGAAEGFDGLGRKAVLIANTVDEWVDQTVRLYKDEGLWGSLRSAGLEYVTTAFSPQVARQELERILEDAAEAKFRRAKPRP